jgi:hypothetical protein
MNNIYLFFKNVASAGGHELPIIRGRDDDITLPLFVLPVNQSLFVHSKALHFYTLYTLNFSAFELFYLEFLSFCCGSILQRNLHM